MDIHKWIEIDPFYRQQIDLKEKLLQSNRRNDLLIYSEKAYDGAMEVLEMLIDHLPDQYPFMFQRNTTKTSIINSITDKQFSITNMKEMHPLEIAALLVQEDLVIMQLNPDTQTYHANVRITIWYFSSISVYFLGVSGLFSIWLDTQKEIFSTFTIDSFARSAILQREIRFIS